MFFERSDLPSISIFGTRFANWLIQLIIKNDPIMTFNNFQTYAISKEQQNNISGGNWRNVRNLLISHYGTSVTNLSTEIESSFNPITGQMSESNFVTVTMEFADGSGEIFQVNKQDYDRYYGRICRIFDL